MLMQYLIDGHNLVPHVPGLSLSALDDEQQLIELLQDYCRVGRNKVEVYFDNAPPGHSGRRAYGAVIAHYVRQGSSADAAIRSRLTRLGKSAANWGVVSSDHQVQAGARAARARVIPSPDFARMMMAAPDRVKNDAGQVKGENVPPEEVYELEKLFKERDDQAKQGDRQD